MGEAQSNAPAGRPSTPGPDPLIGRVVNDRFRIVSLIARGGMGKVYRAEQAPLGRQVALKVLNPSYSGDSDPEFHKRFFLEASTCSKLSHPNTVTIFDYGRTDDDIYYISMELLEGRTLHRALRDDGPFAPGRAMHIARQVCRSLREAHALGVIHRDLKPANVFLVKHGDESDFVKVLDFGLVKDLEGTGEDLTQTGLFMGSPKYMAPEQIRGEKVDGRADVYALGVILYEMLTGKVPFDRPNSVNILMAHVHEPPPPMRTTNPNVLVPDAVEALVLKALEKAPEARYAGMDEMLVALKEVASDSSHSRSTDIGVTGEFSPLVSSTGQLTPVSITGATRAQPGSVPPASAAQATATPTPSRRGPLLAIVGAGLLAIGAAVAVILVFGAEDEPIARQTAPAEVDVRPDVPAEQDTARPDENDPQVLVTMVSLRSTPPGAMVQVGDREYGPTPATVEWSGADAERGRSVTFRFHLDGHQDFSVTRIVSGDQLDVEATLTALRAARPFRPTRPSRPTGERPVGPIKGYKMDPY